MLPLHLFDSSSPPYTLVTAAPQPPSTAAAAGCFSDEGAAASTTSPSSRSTPSHHQHLHHTATLTATIFTSPLATMLHHQPPPSIPLFSLPPQILHGNRHATLFLVAAAVVAGWAVRRQTTIVVAVGRRYSHHSRTMWCRAVAAQPLGVPRCAHSHDATAMAAAEPAVATTATTAAPWWCRADVGIPPFV
ncbi:hypothetical protein Tco_0797747 [Tanacetum coccineum]